MAFGETMPVDVERVAAAVVDAAFHLHSDLGPGLLESIYEACLARSLAKRGLDVRRQVRVPIEYDGERFEEGFRLDLLVGGRVVVEVKAVDAVHPIHRAQVQTYLKLTGHPLAILINFNVRLIKDGIHRIALTDNLRRRSPS